MSIFPKTIDKYLIDQSACARVKPFYILAVHFISRLKTNLSALRENTGAPLRTPGSERMVFFSTTLKTKNHYLLNG
jgi:hypothetical protein